MTALIYGESPINMIEKFSRPHHIRAEKKASPLCHSIIAANQVVLTPGIGITAKNLYTNIRSSTAIIFLRKSRILKMDCKVERIIRKHLK